MTNELEDPTTGRLVGVNGWAAEHRPAAATQATIGKAAEAGFRNVCRSITVTLACGATPQTPITAVLRDGATGVGAVLWSAVLAAPANSACVVALSDLDVVGSINTVMTLEFTGAGVANSLEAVAMSGTVARKGN